MKKVIPVVFASLLASSFIAVAGPYPYEAAYVKRSPGISSPNHCDCFDIGPFASFFAAGLMATGDNLSLDSRSGRLSDSDDAVGGGVSAGYFFNEFVGFEVSGMWTDNDHDVLQSYDLSAILRFPIEEIGLAPYIYGGAGLFLDDSTQTTFHAGAGLDLRFKKLDCAGIFADGRYVWAEDTDNYAVVRAGIRVNF